MKVGRAKKIFYLCMIRFLRGLFFYQLGTLESQLNVVQHDVNSCEEEVKSLVNYRHQVDGLLEHIFGGVYGSSLEDRLELEVRH